MRMAKFGGPADTPVRLIPPLLYGFEQYEGVRSLQGSLLG